MTAIDRTSTPAATKIGRVLSILMVIFLLGDAVSHFLRPDMVVQSLQQVGFPIADAPLIGALQLACLVLYVIPRTAVLGAIFETAYLGGAFCAQLRVDMPLIGLLFPVATAVVVWAGLYLRHEPLRKALGVDILASR